MKRLILLILIAMMFLAHGVTQAQDDLGSNIMRRVNSIVVELDKAEDALKRQHMEAFQGYIKGAEKEYAKIFEYYPGKADPEHPVLAELKKRMDSLHARAAPPADETGKPQ